MSEQLNTNNEYILDNSIKERIINVVTSYVKNRHNDKKTSVDIFKSYNPDEISEIKQKWLTDLMLEYNSLRAEYNKIQDIINNDDVYTYLDDNKRKFMNKKANWLRDGILFHKKLLDKELKKSDIQNQITQINL